MSDHSLARSHVIRVWLMYEENMCKAINTVLQDHPNAVTWVAGDFNLPDVNWETDIIESHRQSQNESKVH